MNRILLLAAVFTLGLVMGLCFREGLPRALAGGGVEKCAAQNGDVNADAGIDLSDAMTILGHLFLGGPTELVPLCASLDSSPVLPATGQTKCYDVMGNVIDCVGEICVGQDAAYLAGCPAEGRFVDNGDGTVSDNCTGLMWQKVAGDTNGDGQSTDQDYVQWCDALDFCEGLTFAGHDDWRLPNVRELQSIIDYGRSGPAIDPVFGAFASIYWSSTTFAGDPDKVWRVQFNFGNVYYDGKAGKEEVFHVRAVRRAHMILKSD